MTQLRTKSKKSTANKTPKLKTFKSKVSTAIDKIDDSIAKLFPERDLTVHLELLSPLKVCLLENDTTNVIEKRLARQIWSINDSDISQVANLTFVDSPENADVILFFVSDQLSQPIYNALKFYEEIPKIGLIVTASRLKHNLNDISHLNLVFQGLSSSLSKVAIQKIFNITRFDKAMRMPLSYLVDVARDNDETNTYTIQFNNVLLGTGLYELIADSLPSQYSHLSIQCQDESQTQMVMKQLIYSNGRVVRAGNVVSISCSEYMSPTFSATQYHGKVQLMKIIRRIANA